MKRLRPLSKRTSRWWLRLSVRGRVKIIVRKDHGWPRYWHPKKPGRRWVWKQPEFEYEDQE